jgi:hypothetical protein
MAEEKARIPKIPDAQLEHLLLAGYFFRQQGKCLN